jgi:tRNA(adenine34) deaminase
MMSRCIELSKEASSKGEFPFSALIVKGDQVISEALNEVNRQLDITRHAELLAISKAQQVHGKANLVGCTIYSNVEPCPMCSFAIREARLGRVVFGMASPLMGGFSRWNLLADGRISEVMPEAFGPPPVVLAGVLGDRVEAVWSEWNPLVWRVIRHRGCFDTAGDVTEWHPPKKRRGALKTLLVAIERYVAPFVTSSSRTRNRKSA